MVLALGGCHVSDFLWTADESAQDGAEGARPTPEDAGDGTGDGAEETDSISVPQFLIQVFVSPENGGTVSLDPSGGMYAAGAEVTLVAVPSDGFTFAGYSGDVFGGELELTIILDGDMVVVAEFVPASIRVSASVEPSGTGVVTLVPPGGVYDWGSTVTLDAQPKPGFSFAAYVNPEDDVVSRERTYSLIVKRDVVLTALFVAAEPELFRLSAEVDPLEGGIVLLAPSGGVYVLGTTVNLIATPNPGFVFEAFEDSDGGVLGTQAVHSVRVTEDALFIARFVPSSTIPPATPVTLAVEVVPIGSGRVSLDPPGGQYPVGTVVILTATAAPGYVFSAYSGHASGTNPTTTVSMDGSKSVRAAFEWSPRVGNPGNLLVTGFAGHNVAEFDRFEGAPLGDFVFEASGDLALPGGIDFGPNADLFVANFGGNNVLRFDGATGAFLGEFAAVPGFFSLLTLRFGPNGHLYVSDTASDSILEFDGNSGALVRTFVSAQSGGLDNPVGLAFAPGGNLFVVSQRTNSVIEYDGTTGTVVGTFADLAAAGFTVPIDLAFNAAGDAFVTTSGNDSVARVNGSTRIVTTFVGPGAGGLDSPAGITIHPDTGNILVVNQSTDQVLEYEGSSGEFLGVFANGEAGQNLLFLAFRPR